jgi:multiple sugar transport system permease protein
MTADVTAWRRSPVGRLRPSGGRRHGGRFVPLLPAVALLVLFLAGPIVWCVYAAFTDQALTGIGATGSKFVGLANFRQMFADPIFRKSLIYTVIFVAGSAVIGQNVLGMFLAIVMRGRNRVFRAIIGGTVMTGWIIPEIVAAFLWNAFLGQGGGADSILKSVGLPHPDFLFTYPLLSIIIANVWRGTAFSMLVFSAAISEVPTDLLEAAAVDGAGPSQRLRRITLPLMKRSIMTNLMLVTLQTLSVFTLVFAMTGGGPGDASETLPIYMYQEAFKFYQLGFGAAVALILLLVGALFSLIYVRALRVEM